MAAVLHLHPKLTHWHLSHGWRRAEGGELVLLLSGISGSSLGHLHVNGPGAAFSYQHPPSPPPSLSLSVSHPFSALHTSPDIRESQRERGKKKVQVHHCGQTAQTGVRSSSSCLCSRPFSTDQSVTQQAFVNERR